MRPWIRSHLTYANVMVTILAFAVLGGGTALAAGMITSNSQIGPGTISGHKPPSGKHANIIAGSISGKDIADRSGVDTCQTPLTVQLGPICAGSDGVSRNWPAAVEHCAGYGLRLPSYSEAEVLARNYDVPGVPPATTHLGPFFWTDAHWEETNSLRATAVDEDGLTFDGPGGATNITVCVTDPSA